MLGNATAFSAKVTNTTDTAVNWSVNDVPGGNGALGTITPDGVYTAPAVLPIVMLRDTASLRPSAVS